MAGTRYLVEVPPARRGDGGAYAELVGIGLAGHLHNGQPCALHCMTCMPGQTPAIVKLSRSPNIGLLCCKGIISLAEQLVPATEEERERKSTGKVEN